MTHLNNGPVNLLSRNRNEDPNTGPWAQVVQYLNDQLPKWHRNLVLLFMGVMNSTSGWQGRRRLMIAFMGVQFEYKD